MASVSATTHNHDFEKQRELLISEIAESLGRCITSVNQLNRNIESVTSVGSNFTPVTMLWKQFENVMIDSSNAVKEAEQKEPILPPPTTSELPSNVAPGGGEAVPLAPADGATETGATPRATNQRS